MIPHRVLVALISVAICLSFLVTPIEATTDELDESKNKAKRTVTYLLSSIFPQTGEDFSNKNYGVDIKYPKNWTGFEMKVILPMAIVSPDGFNITGLFSKYIDSSLDNMTESIESIVSNNHTELSEQDIQKLIEPKIQESAESLSKNMIEYMENKTTTMSIFIYDKELVGFINSVIPNSTESVDSLTSLYERLVDASNSTFTCDRITSNQTILNSNISAEVLTEKCLFTDSNTYQDNLNYFVLTPRALVGIQYSSDSNNEVDKLLPEFEEALKTLSVEESLPINNQTIAQFLNIEDPTTESTNTSSISDLIDKGNSLYELGKDEEAITWYDKALAVDPKSVEALYNKALSTHNLGKDEEAIIWFDKVLEVDPRAVDALFNKGVALGNIGKFEESLQWIDKALEVDPRDANTLYNKGNALGDLGRHEEAITWYDKALEVDPKNVKALNNKGTELVLLKRYEDAVTSFDKALEVYREDNYTLFNKGVALDKLGRYEEAISSYDNVLALNPKDLDALINKALSLNNLGKKAEALIWIDKALAIDPNNQMAIDAKSRVQG